MTTERFEFGAWKRFQSLGKGGQGEVFLAKKLSETDQRLIDRIREAVSFLSNQNNTLREAEQKAAQLIRVMRDVSLERDAPRGALKVLHPIPEKHSEEKALGRMKQEIEALNTFDHPALVRLYESNPKEKWLVMEYFDQGTLTDHLARTRGDLLAALSAFRPLVEAVSQLHEKGFVHRDVKPENVFVADDGLLC